MFIAIIPIIPNTTAKNKNHNLNSEKLLPNNVLLKEILISIIELIIARIALRIGFSLINLLALLKKEGLFFG